MKIQGRVWTFGDHVDTDLIIPARYLNVSDKEELARHCFADLRPGFVKEARPGDIVVAGLNFGCGSSREQAPLAIKYAGISAVLAQSFARIFYRNAINVGLPVLECLDADKIKEGDALSVDLAQGIITDTTQNITLDVKPLPDVMLGILKAGGLANYFKKNKGF